MSEYDYEDSAFVGLVNEINTDILQDVVWVNENITALFFGCSSEIGETTTVKFHFNATLSGAEIAELDGIVAAHTGSPNPPSALDQVKNKATKMIDAYAGQARARYITVVPGQTGTYLKKEIEAQAHKDAAYPTDLTNYGWVQKELNALLILNPAATAQDATDGILNTAAFWIPKAQDIEELRLTYKNEVSIAVNENEVMALANKAKALLEGV